MRWRTAFVAVGAAPLATFLLACSGCSANQPVNPSFSLSLDQARAEVREMQARPRKSMRPVVVISGYADPGVGADFVAQELRDVLGQDTTIIKAASGLIGSMDEARDAVILRVDEALPPSPDQPGWTTEVDVVGVSMGGLVAAYAAMPRDDGGRRLNIARLFTICSPLRGARAADVPTLEDRVVDMRRGSAFLTKVNNAPREYEVFAYCRLGDRIVGGENAAPEGVTPWWVATPPIRLAHLGSVCDWRIVADIARRLRGEPGYAVEPAAALPIGDR